MAVLTRFMTRFRVSFRLNLFANIFRGNSLRQAILQIVKKRFGFQQLRSYQSS